MEIQDLLNFGMTKTEAKIYLEIAKLGGTQIGLIIKRTELHRGTVYNSINDLIGKGFLSFIDKDRNRFYKISGKKIFEEIIKEKQKEDLKKEKQVERFFEDLTKLKGGQEKQDVQVFYGAKAFKSLFLEMMEECKKNNCGYYVQGRGGEGQKTLGPVFYKHFQKLKKKMKIKCKAIISTETKNWNYNKYFVADKRYLQTKINSRISFWIYGNIVLFVLFGADPLVSIKIKSESLSDCLKNYFEHLWKIARS